MRLYGAIAAATNSGASPVMMKPENPSCTASKTSAVRSSSIASALPARWRLSGAARSIPRECTVVLPELEHRIANAGIRLARTPEILADRVHVVRLDPQSAATARNPRTARSSTDCESG